MVSSSPGILGFCTSVSQSRAAGQGLELFRDCDAVENWLKQAAPTKHVDEAWLDHVHNITTAFVLRPVSRNAWQVLSENFGDGDIEKNHVYLYRDLLEGIRLHLPDDFSAEFIDPGLGHCDQVSRLGEQTGVLDLQGAWRRIQDGYVWSKIVGSRETVPGDFRDIGENGLRIDILRFKTNVSQKLHCTSRVNIGKHKLVDWLAPSVWGTSSGGRGGNPHDFLKGSSR
ncbi:LOW QUALITY PROTEIN: hypothetical protein Ct61P_00491 [Colletotrichum tofieldiae]|nr:LOW QUALITY PROTEIN: hypothetical protein Ct61P_00491 [Colletotrichum tofieldiae]